MEEKMGLNDLFLLAKHLDKILPDCSIDRDNEGQIIIYTGEYMDDETWRAD